MRIRGFWLPSIFLLIPAAAAAHGHNADASAKGSGTSGSVLGGIHVAVAKTLPVPGGPHSGNKIRIFSVVGDVSVHPWGSPGKSKRMFVGGLRVTVARRTTQRQLPFFHALVGLLVTKNGNSSDKHLAVTLGGGLDYMISGDVESGWGIRGQADYVHAGTNSPRASFGIVKRWPRH